MSRPLLVTLGDPAGLGPELAVRLFRDAAPYGLPVVLVGLPSALAPYLPSNDIAAFAAPLDAGDDLSDLAPGLYILNPLDDDPGDVVPGVPSPVTVRVAGASLELAANLMNRGVGRALVTCPLSKEHLRAGGFDFPGHTEFLASHAGLAQDEVCMLLMGPSLAVSLVTTHPALRDVPGLITKERVARRLVQTCEFARRLGRTAPVAVCGLNPHAGEGGTIGDEEARIIVPAIAEVRDQGFDVTGPLPADSLFHRAAAGEFAAVLAMYHDQGLGPLKVLDFGKAINVTLGLPYVRTSPDHGTGFDLVGTGKARVDSLKAAVNLALELTSPA
jgi:4-hydroxythreonine-4-phosphate dehydrogenase